MTFQFRPGLAVATLVALAILVSLGVWQLQRLQWKLDLIAQTEARVSSEPIAFDQALARAAAGENMEYQPVRLEGQYVPAGEARVFAAVDGAPGALYFTPLVRADGDIVFVNRGFVPQAGAEAAPPPEGGVVVEGLFRAPERRAGVARMVAPVDQPADDLFFTRDPARLAAHAGVEAAAFYVDSFAQPGADWPRGGLTRLDFSNRHLEYALTWFGLAATLVGVFLAFSMRRGR